METRLPLSPLATPIFSDDDNKEAAPKTVEQLMEDESLVLVEDVVKGG